MGGTIEKTSLITEAINGIIINDKIIPAQRIPIPFWGPENKIPIIGICPKVELRAG